MWAVLPSFSPKERKTPCSQQRCQVSGLCASCSASVVCDVLTACPHRTSQCSAPLICQSHSTPFVGNHSLMLHSEVADARPQRASCNPTPPHPMKLRVLTRSLAPIYVHNFTAALLSSTTVWRTSSCRWAAPAIQMSTVTDLYTKSSLAISVS